MTQDDVFLQAIIETPDDDTPRLVYADWLEERGDWRAEAFRKHPEIARFLSDLVHDADASLRRLGEWVFGGRGDLTRALALILRCPSDVSGPVLRFPRIAASTLERVRQTLCPVPDVRSATPLIRRLVDSPPKSDEVANLASQLASEHDIPVLLAVLEHDELDGRFLEFLACLAQEMVLRGVNLAGVQVAERIAARLMETGHPLAWLPLSLTAVEGDLRWLLPYREGQTTYSRLPAGPSRQVGEAVAAGTPATTIFVETTDFACSEFIRRAVRNWQERSNGKAEAREFRAEPPLGPENLVTGLMCSLGLACLEGAMEQNLRAERVTPCDAFAILFSAASSGGAYGGGLGGAYGRLAAWQSLAGLADAPGEPCEVAAGLAAQCFWVNFHAQSRWYREVAWNVGLLAVRPGGTSLAVLAATDTD